MYFAVVAKSSFFSFLGHKMHCSPSGQVWLDEGEEGTCVSRREDAEKKFKRHQCFVSLRVVEQAKQLLNVDVVCGRALLRSCRIHRALVHRKDSLFQETSKLIR